MTKSLVLGTGPLLEPGARIVSAHCLRVWQIVKPLLDAGHEVGLFTLPIYSDEPERQTQAGVADSTHEGFAYKAFRNNDDAHNLARLTEFCARFQPDCLIGVNAYPASLLSYLNVKAPLWADHYGYAMVEGQVQAARRGSNSLQDIYWAMEEASLRRADKFSTVSTRQFYALHGELAAVGRMNRHTFAYPFATTIPAAVNPLFHNSEACQPGQIRLRGGLVPEGSFILLWSGGYNVWTEVEALAGAIDKAMGERSELHYVSTGGALHGYDESTYARFEAAVERSPYRKRYHLLGWVDAAELPAIYADADLGLCIDSRNYETMFGTRTRAINMMAAGLPLLTTDGAELSGDLIEAGVVMGCESDAPDIVARAIVEACRDRGRLKPLADRGRRHVLEFYSYQATTEPLLKWVAHPTFAPDNQAKLSRAGSGANPFASWTNPIEEDRMRAASASVACRSGALEPVKRLAERLAGRSLYSKLRYLRQRWLRVRWPAWRKRKRELREGKPGRLEELHLILTWNPPTTSLATPSSGQDSPGTDELSLEELRRLAASIPNLRRLVIKGGEPLRHPHCREIAQTLARASQAGTLTLLTYGLQPTQLEAFCGGLLEEGLPGDLEAQIRLDGLEAAQNEIAGDPRAWLHANHSLELLNRLRRRWKPRFRLAALTFLSDRNWRDLQPLNDWLQERYDCDHLVEFVRSSEFSVWNLPEAARVEVSSGGLALPPKEEWKRLARIARRNNRRAGIPRDSEALVPAFSARMLAKGGRIMECVSAGQNVGVIYPNGSVGMCEFSRPAANLRDHGLDFFKTWTSSSADEMRGRLKACHCTHGCYLAKNIEYSRAGIAAMARDL